MMSPMPASPSAVAAVQALAGEEQSPAPWAVLAMWNTFSASPDPASVTGVAGSSVVVVVVAVVVVVELLVVELVVVEVLESATMSVSRSRPSIMRRSCKLRRAILRVAPRFVEKGILRRSPTSQRSSRTSS